MFRLNSAGNLKKAESLFKKLDTICNLKKGDFIPGQTWPYRLQVPFECSKNEYGNFKGMSKNGHLYFGPLSLICLVTK